MVAAHPQALVIEDDYLNSELCSQIFKKMGFSVAIAASGAQAMDWLEANVPEVVVLDVLLPDMSGLEILAYIRTDPRLKHMRVIITTAHHPDELDGNIDQADLVLMKPVMARDLMRHIQELAGSV